MKIALLTFLSIFFLPALKHDETLSIIDQKKNNVISCGDYTDGNIDTAKNGKFIIALPGWGHYAYTISTKTDSAQFYFNQGLTMYYSYHLKEAVASFREAARFDPACAMTYWGQALAMGPYYNSAHTYKMPAGVPAILQLMNNAAGNASDKEKHIIEAMNKRYSSDRSDLQRETLNREYAESMRELISRYPGDPDIKELYIDAVMLIHPWDFWNNDGTPKNWTPEIVDLCATVLKEHPNHPGALHYYIHLTEASHHPEVALPNAEMLKELFPGVAHMVHMSSHEYERNGLFAAGVDANNKADDALVYYESLASNVSLNKHSSHYFAVQTYCALSGAMYDTAMHAAMRCRNSVSPSYEKTYEQYLFMMPVLTNVRLGKWEEILRDSIQPDERWTYASLLNNFARGLAFVYNGNADSALVQLLQLRVKEKDTILKVRRIPFNSPSQLARIAEKILNAVILFPQKKYDEAISSLTDAVRIEDSLIYTEPKDWLIPARQFLGAYLLELGKPAMAEKIYREDILLNPGNGWSLLGLCHSLEVQHKNKDVAAYKAQYLHSFSHADHIPPASVYLK